MNSIIEEKLQIVPSWLAWFLPVIGLFNIFWGLGFMLYPEYILSGLGIAGMNSLAFWETAGALEFTLGVGLLAAFTNMARHWVIIAGALFLKIAIVLIAIFLYSTQFEPAELGLVIITKMLWWIPLSMILYYIYLNFIFEYRLLNQEQLLESDIEDITTNRGEPLSLLALKRPVLLVFLRHLDCVYCDEMLREITRLKEQIDRSGKELVTVHMSSDEIAQAQLDKYGLTSHLVSDPDRHLYRYFGLRRGFISEVVRSRNWTKFLSGSLLLNLLRGTLREDIFQLPGIFIYKNGFIHKRHIHQNAADHPDYEEIIAFEA